LGGLAFPSDVQSLTMEYRIAMNSPAPRSPARRTPLILAALAVLAILGFAGVSRLVTRLKANEKQIAWHAYQAGLAEVQAGHAESALDDFRAALVYDRDNPSYQLSLARALRDSERLDESEGYLLHLWGAAPQDSTINLALARLAARRQSIDNALRYCLPYLYPDLPLDSALRYVSQAEIDLRELEGVVTGDEVLSRYQADAVAD
jgi:predicted Zn-dependent protease